MPELTIYLFFLNIVSFTPDEKLNKLILEDDSVWFSTNKFKVKVKVKISKKVSDYFLRRTLIANQVVEEKLDDGSLIISTEVGHSTQLLPIIKHWIPHIQIISPESLQQE